MNPIGWVKDFIKGAVSGVDLARRISTLLFSREVWIRFAVVLAGLALIVTGAVILFRRQISTGVVSAAKVAAVAV